MFARKSLIGVVCATWVWAAAAMAAEEAGPEQPPPRGGWGTSVGEATFQIDPITGAIIVIADEETNQHIQDVIKNLDQPVPQALIKVLFLEVTHANSLDLGVEASFRSGPQRSVTTDADGNEIVTIDGWEDTLETIFGVATAGQGGFYRLLREDLDATLYALSQVGKLEVLSRPSIMTRNNETAVITLGQEVPLISNSRVTQDGQIINTVEYVDVGIILEVTPRITPDGLVEMLVAPEISTISGETVQVSENFEAFVIAKRAAETTVIVPDGMTVVIGGLMEDNEIETVRKIPIVGDIPWIGSFFRRTTTQKSKTELLIFLTPIVVRQMSSLETLAQAETANSELTRVAFTDAELNKHLDNADRLLPKREPAPRVSAMKRMGSWIWTQVQIFR